MGFVVLFVDFDAGVMGGCKIQVEGGKVFFIEGRL